MKKTYTISQFAYLEKHEVCASTFLQACRWAQKNLDRSKKWGVELDGQFLGYIPPTKPPTPPEPPTLSDLITIAENHPNIQYFSFKGNGTVYIRFNAYCGNLSGVQVTAASNTEALSAALEQCDEMHERLRKLQANLNAQQ